jgi:hypothetical protein
VQQSGAAIAPAGDVIVNDLDAVPGAVIGVTGPRVFQPLLLNRSALIFVGADLLVAGPNNRVKIFLTRRVVGTPEVGQCP